MAIKYIFNLLREFNFPLVNKEYAEFTVLRLLSRKQFKKTRFHKYPKQPPSHPLAPCPSLQLQQTRVGGYCCFDGANLNMRLRLVPLDLFSKQYQGHLFVSEWLSAITLTGERFSFEITADNAHASSDNNQPLVSAECLLMIYSTLPFVIHILPLCGIAEVEELLNILECSSIVLSWFSTFEEFKNSDSTCLFKLTWLFRLFYCPNGEGRACFMPRSHITYIILLWREWTCVNIDQHSFLQLRDVLGLLAECIAQYKKLQVISDRAIAFNGMNTMQFLFSYSFLKNRLEE